jgi:hypothetical protein
MKREHHKNRLPPFVPMLIATIDSPAWKALSHGARSLYLALKRRVSRGRNQAYISHRDAAEEIGSSRTKGRGLVQELRHFRFVVLAKHGCLGLDGKGKAPHWRLTELGVTSKASAGGIFEPPTNDFLKWDGIPFKKQDPGLDGLSTGCHPWPRRVVTPKREWPTRVCHRSERSGLDGVAITSITTPKEISPSHGKPWTKPTIDSGERRFKPRRRKAGRA